MKLEDRLDIVLKMQRINELQISNREKTLQLSKKLAQDIENEKIRLEIKKLEVENIGLHQRCKELTSKL